MRPLVTERNPEMHSINVVLPAPLGPISPTISPSHTWRSTLPSASRPPNRTVTPVQSRRTGASVREKSASMTSSDSVGVGEPGAQLAVGLVGLGLVDHHLLRAVGVAALALERDGPADQVVVVVVGAEGGDEALPGEVTSCVAHGLHPEVDELVPGGAA